MTSGFARIVSSDARSSPHFSVSLVTAPFAGRLYWLATRQDGTVTRLDAEGNIAPVSQFDLAEAAKRIAGDTEIAEQASKPAKPIVHHNTRARSKQAAVLALLSRPRGATIAAALVKRRG